MKFAIISDTHDNLATLEKAVNWMNKNNIEEIIHCGDICSPDTLKELSKMFPGKIHVVFGNIDEDIFSIRKKHSEGQTLNVILYGDLGKLEKDSLKISFVHHPKLARTLAGSGNYDLVFYGHTHKPWEEKVSACRLINPGNLSNTLYKASFAVYDTKSDQLELKILETLEGDTDTQITPG